MSSTAFRDGRITLLLKLPFLQKNHNTIGLVVISGGIEINWLKFAQYQKQNFGTISVCLWSDTIPSGLRSLIPPCLCIFT